MFTLSQTSVATADNATSMLVQLLDHALVIFYADYTEYEKKKSGFRMLVSVQVKQFRLHCREKPQNSHPSSM
jgi:hypothetical protein